MRLTTMLGTAPVGLAAAQLPSPGQSQQLLPEPPAAEGDGAAPMDPSEIPSVHNTFCNVPEGAISRNLLSRIEVEVGAIGPLRSVFHMDHMPEVKALDRQEVRVMGYIYALAAGLAHKRFLLTAWPPNCPFCLPAGAWQMVEVRAPEPIGFTDRAVLMGGRFEVREDDPSGMHFRMRQAREVERFEDIRRTGLLNQ